MTDSPEQSFRGPANKKRITTYGKPQRKHMSSVFAEIPTVQQRPISDTKVEPARATSQISGEMSQSEALPQTSTPKKKRKYVSPKPHLDIYDVSESDEEWHDGMSKSRSPSPREKLKSKGPKRAKISRASASIPETESTGFVCNVPVNDNKGSVKLPPTSRASKNRNGHTSIESLPKEFALKQNLAMHVTEPDAASLADINGERAKIEQHPSKWQSLTGKATERRKHPDTRVISEEAGLQVVRTIEGALSIPSRATATGDVWKSGGNSTPPQTLGHRIQKRHQTPPMVLSKFTRKPETPSGLHSPTRMLHSSAARFLSPKGRKIWEGLLGSVVDSDSSHINDIQAEEQSFTPRPRNQYKGVSKASQQHRTPPRRRIIDALVQQSQRNPVQETFDSSDLEEYLPMEGIVIDTEASPKATIGPSSVSEIQEPSGPTGASQNSSNALLKKTYQRQRSFLPEQDLMKELEIGLPSQPTRLARTRRASIPVLTPLACFQEEALESISGSAIRSVHELRQAGANNRFSDEVRDLLDRIGSPATTSPSMRRAGLLEMADKMKNKNFAQQFRAEDCAEKLFLHLGQEADVVAGFVMMSLLFAVLQEGSMPHIVAHLRRHGIARLLIRLLGISASIMDVVNDKKSNMSKAASLLLSEHHHYLLESLAWEELQPRILTPRTLALKCLEMLVRQTRKAGIAGEIMSKELTTTLFDALKTASNDEAWCLPTSLVAIDFSLAVSILEAHSIVARTAQDESIWINDYLPIIATSLQAALIRPAQDFGHLQLLFLRLTLNVTNNNAKASDMFANEHLMATTGQVIINLFARMSQVMNEEELQKTLDSLVLVLGVMINFAEWSLAARTSLQNLEGQAMDPLDKMIQIFVENEERTAEAASIEEGQKNIPYGYLSVLLGYLSLLPSIAGRVRDLQPSKTLKPLIAFIDEFIALHKLADAQIVDEEGNNAHSVMTQRLETLVMQLNTR